MKGFFPGLVQKLFFWGGGGGIAKDVVSLYHEEYEGISLYSQRGPPRIFEASWFGLKYFFENIQRLHLVLGIHESNVT